MSITFVMLYCKSQVLLTWGERIAEPCEYQEAEVMGATFRVCLPHLGFKRIILAVVRRIYGNGKSDKKETNIIQERDDDGVDH